MKSNLETILLPSTISVEDYELVRGFYVCRISQSEHDEIAEDEVMVHHEHVKRYSKSLGLKINSGLLESLLRNILTFVVLNLCEFSSLSDSEKQIYLSNVRGHVDPHNRFVWMQELIEYQDGMRTQIPQYNEDLLLYCIGS